MGIGTELPPCVFCKSERERVHEDGGNPLSVVNAS